ncbi:MAG TPA: YgjP-like metallopeptidase domain-containing protein [Gallionella sp.]|nr:YgjP-like metallopeptidase domain-containing protein [Gallionella sp.]
MKYLAGYPENIRTSARQLIAQNRLGGLLLERYRTAHDLRTDKALYDYVFELKNRFLRNAAPLNKVAYDSRIRIMEHALGQHTRTSRVQGGKLKASREIRIASLFREVPLEFLRMIAVHELAHLKETEHGKAFYQLCVHMEPEYHQYELDLRLYLTQVELCGKLSWPE